MLEIAGNSLVLLVFLEAAEAFGLELDKREVGGSSPPWPTTSPPIRMGPSVPVRFQKAG